MRRAPSRASPSSVPAISSSPSPTGSLRTSSMACLPLPPHGGRSLSTGKVRRLHHQAHPQLLGIAPSRLRASFSAQPARPSLDALWERSLPVISPEQHHWVPPTALLPCRSALRDIETVEK